MKKSCLFKDFKLMSTRINTIRAFQEILQITTFTTVYMIGVRSRFQTQATSKKSTSWTWTRTWENLRPPRRWRRTPLLPTIVPPTSRCQYYRNVLKFETYQCANTMLQNNHLRPFQFYILYFIIHQSTFFCKNG